MKRDPYPLQWPDGWDRTPASKRARSAFVVSGFAAVRDEVIRELGRLGATRIVITSDLPIRSDGLPYANGRADDPGISVWWVKDGVEQVMACDRWRTHAENLRAIEKSVDAIRGLARWGASDLVRRAFAGFAALPAGDGREYVSPAPPAPPRWREVLGGGILHELAGDDLLAVAKARHRRLIKDAHPDAGGDAAIAAELNAALEAAERELAP